MEHEFYNGGAKFLWQEQGYEHYMTSNLVGGNLDRKNGPKGP